MRRKEFAKIYKTKKWINKKKGLLIKGINKDLSFYRKQSCHDHLANKIELVLDIECPKCHKMTHIGIARVKNEWETDKIAIRCNCERPIDKKYLSAPTTTEKGMKTARHGLTHDLWFKKFIAMNQRANKLKINVSPDWTFHASRTVDDLESIVKTKENFHNFMNFIEDEFKILKLEFDEDVTGYRVYIKEPIDGYNKNNCYIKPIWMPAREAEELRTKNITTTNY